MERGGSRYGEACLMVMAIVQVRDDGGDSGDGFKRYLEGKINRGTLGKAQIIICLILDGGHLV